MPALTAHKKLSELVFDTLNEDMKLLIQADFPMYFLGAQGPDLLFYYKPYKSNPVVVHGSVSHQCTGAEFFEKLLKIRENWSPSLTAYLLGVCCHYSLDRNVHPYVYEVAPGTFLHQKLEAEFDLHIMKTFGLNKNRFEVIPKNGINPHVLCEVYDMIDAKMLSKSAKSFRTIFKLLRHNILVRLFEKLLHKNGDFSSLCLPKKISSVNEINIMFERFNSSVADASHLMDTLLHADSQEIKNVMNNNFKGDVS